MPDINTVIHGLECCILRNPDDKARCSDCSYEGNCVNRLKMDALKLLKEYRGAKPLIDAISDQLHDCAKMFRRDDV